VNNEKLGSGRRFRALESKLAARRSVKNPAALAAAIGRKKYGGKRMAQLAARGRERAAGLAAPDAAAAAAAVARAGSRRVKV
jgi:hypothetical protein